MNVQRSLYSTKELADYYQVPQTQIIKWLHKGAMEGTRDEATDEWRISARQRRAFEQDDPDRPLTLVGELAEKRLARLIIQHQPLNELARKFHLPPYLIERRFGKLIRLLQHAVDLEAARELRQQGGCIRCGILLVESVDEFWPEDPRDQLCSQCRWELQHGRYSQEEELDDEILTRLGFGPCPWPRKPAEERAKQYTFGDWTLAGLVTPAGLAQSTPSPA